MKNFIRNFVFLFICVLVVSKTNMVFAKENYYTNDNGVTLSKKEYNFLKKLYNERYISILTPEKYNEFKEENLFDAKITSTTSTPEITVYDAIHRTEKKEIKMTSGCTGNICRIVIDAYWFYSPGTRSYDLIGARFNVNTEVTHKNTIYLDTQNHYTSHEYKTSSNGIGCSVLLKNGGDVEIIQDFKVPTGRIVYGTYQHATKGISLTNSKRYTFGFGGYGKVFLFDNIGKDTYDRMAGVQLNV